jgi:8-amino-7-oxononanoate synthase
MMKDDPYRAYCEQRQAAHQFRRLVASEILPEGRVRRDGVSLINFASNDYLGLSQHPLLIERARECAARYGAGSTASRLITGNNPLHERIEAKLAAGKGTEAALVLASGYQANLTVLAALADSGVVGRPVTILADRLSHNSLLQGGLLGGAVGDTKLLRFHHNDAAHLEILLRQQAEKNAQAIIVTESVFGMDGDCADLDALTTLAETYQAMLYVDEAHATGLYGPSGFGFCAAHKGRVDIAMGTFGKALGSFGAYIACSAAIRDYLVQRCGGLIYSTALPPMVLGAIDAALDLLPQLDHERAHLAAMAARLRKALQAQGWNCGASATHIIPVILGDEEAATNLSDHLREHGILAPAIRPPTVPRGTSRLRLSLSAAHKDDDIDHLIAAMKLNIPSLSMGEGQGGGETSRAISP